MYFSKAITIAAVALFTSALAAPAADPVAEAAQVEGNLAPRGFGCPFDRNECNEHVSSPQHEGSIWS